MKKVLISMLAAMALVSSANADISKLKYQDTHTELRVFDVLTGKTKSADYKAEVKRVGKFYSKLSVKDKADYARLGLAQAVGIKMSELLNGGKLSELGREQLWKFMGEITGVNNTMEDYEIDEQIATLNEGELVLLYDALNTLTFDLDRDIANKLGGQQ